MSNSRKGFSPLQVFHVQYTSELPKERPSGTPAILEYVTRLSIIAGTSTALTVALSPAHSDGVTVWKQPSMHPGYIETKD